MANRKDISCIVNSVNQAILSQLGGVMMSNTHKRSIVQAAHENKHKQLFDCKTYLVALVCHSFGGRRTCEVG